MVVSRIWNTAMLVKNLSEGNQEKVNKYTNRLLYLAAWEASPGAVILATHHKGGNIAVADLLVKKTLSFAAGEIIPDIIDDLFSD